jgi:trans-aconitate methyltransferase
MGSWPGRQQLRREEAMTEWKASAYACQSSLQQAMAEEQLALLVLEGTERILDVGCGDGKITAAIAARVPRGSVVGVDPSRDMVVFAANHFGPPARDNLRFEVADVRRLPYRNKFDLIVSFNALHWVLEQDAALDSIHTALKPAGRALLRLVPEGPRVCLEDVIEEIRQDPRWAGYFSGFHKPYYHPTPEGYRSLATRHRFQVVRVAVADKAWDFKTRAAFLAFCRATCVEWTKRLPESVWDDFLKAVLDRYQSVAADGAGDANTFKFYQMEVELRADEP